MIPVSTDYKRELIKGNRNYLIKVDVTLAGSISPDFTLTNQEIWDNGITLDNAISSDSSFDIGSAIVGSLTVVINNIKGDYSQYDFFDARLTLYLGVVGDIDSQDVQRYYRIGIYTVDVPTYNGSLITLECLDNMIWFDTPFSDVTGITYPATAGVVVQAICDTVGVTLGTQTFPNYSLEATKVLSEPESNLSCREVLQYVAQMCCCYCKINTAGELVLAWYDKTAINNLIDYDGGTFNTTTTPYSDGCDLDGGTFNPWNTGDVADGGTFAELRDRVFISQNYEIQVSTDDVVITGCRVRNNTSDDSAYDVLWVDSTVEQTHERYVLVIDDNPFITNETKATAIANLVGSILAGLPVRGFTATSLSDFSYETGDMATVVDFRGNRYYTWLTHFTFTTNNSENFSCGVESLKKRGEQRFSTLAETVEKAKRAISAYDKAVKAMDELAQNAIGYNEYIYHSGTGDVMYRFDAIADMPSTQVADPKFPNSNNVFKISGDGVFVAMRSNGDIAPDGTCTYSNGYDANSGTAILNLIYAQGINCDWIHAGTLTLGGDNNEDGQCTVLDALGNTKVHLDNTGIKVYGGSIEGTSFKQESGNDKVSIASGKIMTQGTWIQLCQDISNPDLKHFALGYSQSAYMDNTISPPYFKQIDSKNIIEAGDHYSDERLKTDIEPINDEVVKELVLNASIKQFKRTDEPKKQRYGVIAQAVRKQLDDVGLDKENVKLTSEDSRGYYQIEYREYIPMLMRTVQIQQEQIDLLKKELAELKAKVK